MTTSLRAGVTSDVPVVLDLWRFAGAEATHTDDVASLEQLVTHDPGALIVAEDCGRIIGSVIAAWDGWRGSIYRLVVAPDYRRQTLGQRLLGAATARLDRVGAVRLQAIVVETDARAMGFWGASGWARQADRARFVYG